MNLSHFFVLHPTKMQSILLLVIIVAIFSCVLSLHIKIDVQWELWKETYNKEYSNTEEHIRHAIWKDNLKKVQEHNLLADRGIYTYWLGMNKYADLTLYEFVKTMHGYNATMVQQRNQHRHTFVFNSSLDDLPSFVDWRDRDVVTGIKDQNTCGASWAFAATGALEGQTAIHTGNLISLSEQNLIDCSQKQGTMGCNGGLVNQAFEYIKENQGVDTETSYPYEGKMLTCRFKKEDVGAKDTGYINLPSNDENALQQAVAYRGPMAIAIDASHSSFQLYKSGIYNEPACSQTNLDHAVLAIGYGTDSGIDYWLVKNSWGSSWGMEGYIRMSRNKSNQCGIATAASYPTF